MPKKNISKKSVQSPVIKKESEVRVIHKPIISASNIIVGIIALVIVLAGVYVSLPGRYHFLGDVKKATVQNGVTYQGVNGQNALKLLKDAHNVTTKTYPGIGEYVVTIDGITPDKSHFWSFYVNGKQSQVGASSYITKNSDTLSWKLNSFN